MVLRSYEDGPVPVKRSFHWLVLFRTTVGMQV
jgi:hypothetical protein